MIYIEPNALLASDPGSWLQVSRWLEPPPECLTSSGSTTFCSLGLYVKECSPCGVVEVTSGVVDVIITF